MSVRNDISDQYDDPATYTYSIGERHTRALPDDLCTILLDYGMIAESSDYYLVNVDVTLQGLRGVLSRYTPEVTIDTDGSVTQWVEWTGRWRRISCRPRISQDASTGMVILSDAQGVKEEPLSLESQEIEVGFAARPAPLIGWKKEPMSEGR